MTEPHPTATTTDPTEAEPTGWVGTIEHPRPDQPDSPWYGIPARLFTAGELYDVDSPGGCG